MRCFFEIKNFVDFNFEKMSLVINTSIDLVSTSSALSDANSLLHRFCVIFFSLEKENCHSNEKIQKNSFYDINDIFKTDNFVGF